MQSPREMRCQRNQESVFAWRTFKSQSRQGQVDIEKELAALPRPRKHYQWYSATRAANDDMWHAAQDLQVYSAEYSRTGFQGGLNLYRIFDVYGDLNAFAGRTIDVPSCYIAGASEWGVYQSPGAFEAMQHGACTQLLGVHLVEGAGHSLAEEQPQRVNQLLIDFFAQATANS
jgi:pimeloyl-ACP methyl ester carboxylesterase